VAGGLASPTTVVVPPGPGTPIQDAINAAAPGETIRLTLGAYGENLVIDKALKARGVRSTLVTISGSTNDVVDNGTDNCWWNNTYTTGSVAPCP
jgi:nitrous oxidase accessory protein NosD